MEVSNNGKPMVISLMDHHDEHDLLDHVQELATRGGAHVYVHEATGSYVVSMRPMTARQVNAVVRWDHEGQAREMLKNGESPEYVWHWLYISGAAIGRIARQEGIKLPRGWFARALASEQMRQDGMVERKNTEPAEQYRPIAGISWCSPAEVEHYSTEIAQRVVGVGEEWDRISAALEDIATPVEFFDGEEAVAKTVGNRLKATPGHTTVCLNSMIPGRFMVVQTTPDKKVNAAAYQLRDVQVTVH